MNRDQALLGTFGFQRPEPFIHGFEIVADGGTSPCESAATRRSNCILRKYFCQRSRKLAVKHRNAVAHYPPPT